jgi:hypothetical protein
MFYFFTDLSLETIRTGTVEPVHGFIFQVRSASAVIETWVCQTPYQFHRTIFTTVFSITFAEVAGPFVNAGTMDTRPKNRNIILKIKTHFN